MKKEQLRQQRGESRKLQVTFSEYAYKRLRGHKSSKSEAPSQSLVPSSSRVPSISSKSSKALESLQPPDPIQPPKVPSTEPSSSSGPSLSLDPSLEPSSSSGPSLSSEPSLSSAPSTCFNVGVYSQPHLNSQPPYPCSTETDNLKSIIKHFIKSDSSFAGLNLDESIESLGDELLKQKLSALKMFIMPDIEKRLDPELRWWHKELEYYLAGWDATSRGIIKDYVSEGGILLITGSPQTITFLNAVFGWNLPRQPRDGGARFGRSYMNESNTAGTAWDGYTSSLYQPPTLHLNCTSVPGCKAMWGVNTNTPVATIPYGDGQVIFLGYDFWLTGYEVDGYHVDCIRREDAWVTSVFKGALLGPLVASGC